ncbi:MAG: hypothetical protein ACRDVL_01120, partial [Acidimicrobiia bacterium]
MLFNPDLETSAVMVPAIAGMVLVFVGTLITSLGVVRERQAGTLEQLAVMPFRPRDVFVGKVAPYFLVASVDLERQSKEENMQHRRPLILIVGAVVLLIAAPALAGGWA